MSGDSKTDFNKWSKPKPNDTVLTITYREKVPHSNEGIQISKQRTFESDNKEILKSLEEKFPFEGGIIVYD